MKPILIQQKIHEIRGIKVMLDSDLAALYEIETKVLKQAVKRNLKRFPKDFMFVLTEKEFKNLRSQIVTSSYGGTRYLPFAFTEHGVAMLASILNSEKAIDVNIAVVRAFIASRQIALNMKKLATKITALEKKYNKQFADIYEAINFLITEKQQEIEQKERVRIGFKR